MKPDQQELKRALEEVLKGGMRHHIGRPINEATRESVLSCVAEALRTFRVESSRESITANSAWERMGTWQKCKWFLVNRLVPSIGKELRKQHDRASYFRYQLVEAAAEHGDQYVPTAMDTYEAPELPHWALEDPHSVVLVDFTFVPAVPVKHITFTATTSRP